MKVWIVSVDTDPPMHSVFWSEDTARLLYDGANASRVGSWGGARLYAGEVERVDVPHDVEKERF